MKLAIRSLDLHAMSRLFKALGDETRLRMVALLSLGELCVCHVEAALELSQPTASRHLAVLRAAGVVEARRKGTWMHYRLAAQADDESRRQLRSLAASFARKKLLRRDVERLLRGKGPSSCK